MASLPSDACLIKWKYGLYFIEVSLNYKHRDWKFRVCSIKLWLTLCVFALLSPRLSNKNLKGKIHKLYFSVSHTVPSTKLYKYLLNEGMKKINFNCSNVAVQTNHIRLTFFHWMLENFRIRTIQRFSTKLFQGQVTFIQDGQMSILNLYTWYSPSDSSVWKATGLGKYKV